MPERIEELAREIAKAIAIERYPNSRSDLVDAYLIDMRCKLIRVAEPIITRHLTAWAKERDERKEIIGECIAAVEKGCTRDQLPPDDLDGQYLVYQHGREDALAALRALEGETT